MTKKHCEMLISIIEKKTICNSNMETAFQNIFMNIINNNDVQSSGILANIKMAVGDTIYNNWLEQYKN